MKFLLVTTLIFAFNCHLLFAKSINYSFKDFAEAEKSEDYLKFKGKSTKFKLVTTEFTGYSKKFSLEYQRVKNSLENVKFTIDANSLDTDSSGRNEKLYSLCLKTDVYPNLNSELVGKIVLEEVLDQLIDIQLKIKDKTLTRPLKYSVVKTDKGHKISFSTDFSFIEAGIDDPSIFIAKVHELFIIEGAIHITD